MNGFTGSDYRPKGVNAPAALLAVIAFALGALAFSQGAAGGGPGFYAIGAFLIIVGVLIPASLKMANQWERAVVLRLGKLQKVAGPGLFVIVPVIDGNSSQTLG